MPTVSAACNEDDLRFMDLGSVAVGHRSYVCIDGAGQETSRQEATYVRTQDTRVTLVQVDGVEVLSVRDNSRRGDHQSDGKMVTVLGLPVTGVATESYGSGDEWTSRHLVYVGIAAVVAGTRTGDQGAFSCASHFGGIGTLYAGVGAEAGFCEYGAERRAFSTVYNVGTAEVDWGRRGWTDVEDVRLHSGSPVPYHAGVEDAGTCYMRGQVGAAGIAVSQPLGVHCGLP